MTFWVGLLIGLLVGWLVEWVIDWIYWRRRIDRVEDELEVAEDRIEALERELAECRATAAVAEPGLEAPAADPDTTVIAGGAAASAAAGAAAVAPDTEEDAAGDADEAGEVQTDADAAATTTIVEAAPPRPDDLKKIEGIGPKTSRVLADNGIVTYRQLADTSVERLQEIIDAAGLPRVLNPATWPEQAALAADGKWDELKALTDSLSGGRRKGTGKDPATAL